MEQINKNQINEKGFAFSEDQEDEVVDIIGDSLRTALDEDEDAHHAELMQAALDICTILGGSAVFSAITFELWRVTHTQKYQEVKEIAEKRGIKVTEQLFDDMLSKIAQLIGKKYPPFDMV
jgi:hypothetical protein